jgi:hypothetical protein
MIAWKSTPGAIIDGKFKGFCQSTLGLRPGHNRPINGKKGEVRGSQPEQWNYLLYRLDSWRQQFISDGAAAESVVRNERSSP